MSTIHVKRNVTKSTISSVVGISILYENMGRTLIRVTGFAHETGSCNHVAYKEKPATIITTMRYQLPSYYSLLASLHFKANYG